MRPAVRAAAVVCAVLVGTLVSACHDSSRVTTLRFWAMGREGEVVQELVRDFEAAHPDIRVDVQQIPWTAAHEKLLTAYVGRAIPDVAQLGNTWVCEFVALDALAPLDARVAASTVVREADNFPGIWDTNVIDGTLYGIPWYVDTRVLFYRTDLLAHAGFTTPPTTWAQWRAAMSAVTQQGGTGKYGILMPINEWSQPVILGLQAGSPLLADHDTRSVFTQPDFARAFTWYVNVFRDGLAPPVSNNEVANVYQEFARGTFAMYITGPWNIGEFAHRLPPELQDAWATAPLPGPDAQHAPGVSLAGGSSLVVFRGSEHQDAAWQLVEFLSRPEQQIRFFRLTGDLPAHQAAWQDSALVGDPNAQTFFTQLHHVVPTPKVPEWEQIAALVWQRAEEAVRGAATVDDALARLDADVDRVLAKRRWMLTHRTGPEATP